MSLEDPKEERSEYAGKAICSEVKLHRPLKPLVKTTEWCTVVAGQALS